MSAPTGLFAGLIDDAAVFPPGNAPLPVAIDRHRTHLRSGYASCIGPLLVAATSASELAEELGRLEGDVVKVGLIVRPGRDVAAIGSARGLLRGTAVRVVGAEVGWYEDWLDELADSLPLAVEIPRGPAAARAMREVGAARRDGVEVVAKFRTGATPTWNWPDEGELARFIATATGSEIPFKLTGGLHHAVRGTYPADGENHGLLNILVATAAAQAGATPADLSALLAIMDRRALADLVGTWTDENAAQVRSAFTTYGCCEVTDPITELVDLGLLPDSHLPKENR